MSSRGSISSSPARKSPRRRGGDPPSRGGDPPSASSPLPYGNSAAGSSSPPPGTPQQQARTPAGLSAVSSPLPYGTPHSTTSQAHLVRAPSSSFSPSSSASSSHPRRARGELASPARSRQINIQHSTGPQPPPSDDPSRTSTDHAAPTSEGGLVSRTVIWGTNVNVKETTDKFLNFINTFLDDETGSVKYIKILEKMVLKQENWMSLDCRDLKAFDSTLYNQLVRYPQEVIPAFDFVIGEKHAQMFGEASREPLQVRTHSISEVFSMRDLNPENIDQLISMSGMVIYTSPIIPDPKSGFFQCAVCRFSVEVQVDHGRINEPTTCQSCASQKTFQLVHNRSSFGDKQMVKIQEKPGSVPEGQTPQTVLSFVYDDMVDHVQPGDLVVMTGIYRATSLRLNPRQRAVKSVFKTHVDVIHFMKTHEKRVMKDDAESDIYEDPDIVRDREKQLIALSKQPDIVQRLTRALAPSIYEFDDVKRGVLTMLFGGTPKTTGSDNKGRLRSEINVLLCGDPGTSKSQLLQYAVKLAPRGMYTSGKGSSAVGLTAYVTKDPDTHQIVLESGALVLCDGGICCIDEFDKMNDSTRSVLHEAMEQQTVSIAKAGIIATLNARTSILAAANPQDSLWNPRLSIVDNIQLPPTLLSRFDLIYLILDKPDRAKDRLLARHIVALYYSDQDREAAGPEGMTRELLARYISFARKNISPELSEDAARDLMTHYVEMRKAGNQKRTISATPRQLEALIRLSEAFAKMRYSSVVESSDVSEAVSLMRTALKQAATDPTTGLIDYDLITTGQSMASRNRVGDLAKEIATFLTRQQTRSIQFLQLLNLMNDAADISVTAEDLREALKQLESDEFVKMPSSRNNPNPLIRVIGGPSFE